LLLLSACAPAIPQPAPVAPTRAVTTASVVNNPSPAPTIEIQPTQTATPSCTQAGLFTRQTIVDTPDKQPFVVTVYTPPCYQESQTADLPLLILLHGQDGDDNEWKNLGVGEAADRLISTGQAPPFLIAMPFEKYALADPSASTFGKRIIDTLLPWVETSYHASTLRSRHAIGGISRGAAWAMLLGLTDWQDFAAIGAHSLPPFFGDTFRLPGRLEAIPPGSMPRIWIDIGDKDRYLAPAREFEQVLKDHQIPHEWTINPGNHDAEYWSAHVEEYLQWYAKEW
jgi:enterochelin esterase-like enzyme